MSNRVTTVSRSVVILSGYRTFPPELIFPGRSPSSLPRPTFFPPVSATPGYFPVYLGSLCSVTGQRENVRGETSGVKTSTGNVRSYSCPAVYVGLSGSATVRPSLIQHQS